MKWSDPPQRWFGHWRAVERRPQDDPADFGTAFGLDLSLGECADEPAPPRRPMDGKTGWMQRIVARRKPAY